MATLTFPPLLGKPLARRAGDDAVRDTNDDAQLSKLSCVRHGYFQDSFVHHFVRRPIRRSPLINRGYYSRYAALRGLLLQFLALGLKGNGSRDGSNGGAAAGQQPGTLAQEQAQGRVVGTPAGGQQQAADSQQSEQQTQKPQQQAQQPVRQEEALPAQQQESEQQQGQAASEVGEAPQQAQQQAQQAAPAQRRRPRQVLVLGAGYDTTYFQLAAEGVRADKYVELDFLQVTQKKAAAIQQLPDLLACLGGPDAASGINAEHGRVVTKSYCLLPADLRDLSQLEAAVEAAGLDPTAPTLVLSECVLVYLQPQHSRDIVRWLAEHLECAAMAVYEQIQPHDAFGQQMLLNLESRGCALLGIEATPTLEAQQRRFTDCGWHHAEAHTMDHVYSHCIDPVDRRRTERLELFDEFEEWHLMQQHYCIAVGVKDSSGLLTGFGLPHYAAQQAAVQRPPFRAGAGGQPAPPPPRFVT